MNLFLDFDGTLIDSRMRLFKLFSFLVPSSKLGFAEYWNYKRNGIGHKEILRNHFDYTEQSFLDFDERWMNLIEHPEWIQFDTPFEGVTEKLVELNKSYLLILVTARQSMDVVNMQLDKFNWTTQFSKVLVTEQKVEKTELIQSNFSVTQEDWIVGDTGKDIQVGKQLKIGTAAVLTGFLSKERLKKYEPDILLNSVLDF